MVQHPKSKEWDDNLRKMFDRIDDYLEDKYGGLYPLHPNRMKRGTTSNKSMDGLFNVGASYSSGFGSKYGKGYVIEIYLSTLAGVDPEVRLQIEGEVEGMVEKFLPEYFPGRNLDCEKDGHVLKIFGDLSLGAL
ncbi:MAG: hypothetical protein PQJ59_01100 [Spirochaetales bacterium]|nr:hypothetical protein [Spirochaetales bacterium]